jgi:PKD repeat protein/beta-lactamase superfamily II metal-dependent hydrolase
MKRLNVMKVFFILVMGMIILGFSPAVWAQNLQIHYINVEQGQSILIIGPDGTTILLDGGMTGKGTAEVVPYLQSQGIYTSQALDYIITSHLDTDHYEGLTEVMNYGYDALHVYDNGSDKTNTYVTNFHTAASGTTAGGVTSITLGQVINLGNGATARCVATNGSVIGVGAISGGQANENDRSDVLLIKYGNFEFLTTGDLGGGSDDNACTGRSTSQVNIETPLVNAIMPGGAYPLLSSYGVEVAHIGHHGSESSGNSDYMNQLTPQVACISVGAGQSTDWYHPRVDVVEHVFLAQASCITAPPALVLQTEEGNPSGSLTSFAGYCVGDIVITTDGVSYYTVTANGAITQGPDERNAAGLPATFYFEEGGSGSITANFTGSPTSGTAPLTVSFTDQSTSATSWSWNFGDGGTSTSQNPSHTYTTAGTYTVSLTATNAYGSDTETKTNYITVGAVTYCTSKSNSASGEWIARVQVGTLNNASGSAVYSDFTSINTNLTGGSSVSVTLTPGFSSTTYNQYWKIWIDYNGDYDFVDTGEEEFSASGTSAVSGSFTVNTGINITTRMRVSMKYNAAPTSCETFSYGEVEDYTVTISTSTTQPPVAAFTASATTVQAGGSITFTDQSTNNPTSWSWSFPGGTPSTSTAQNPTVTYNTAGAYNVSLTASNAAGSDDEVKTNYITVTAVSGDDIAEGVDYTSTFTKSGSANWAKVTDVYYYGGDSAKSGTITHSQATTIETSITVASSKDVKFYWKVSSESGYDFLTFYIDGVQKNQISGTVDWTQVSNTIATGTHTLKWTYSKDSSVSSGSDCGWVDKLELVTPSTDPIAEALDYAGLTFTLTGNANWYSQTTTTYYGGDAAQSGLITHSQSTSMETTISGKTTVKFYWRVSSESGYDYLRFYIDGTLKNSISGSTSWAQKTYTVTTGSHVLKWTYSKDASASSGSDCGWVDKLELL